MRFPILLLILLIAQLPQALWAQDDSAPKRKNSVEFFLPVSHFFDESLTNWMIFVPKTKSGPVPYGFDYTKYYAGLPSTFGAAYTRSVGKKSSLCLSATAYAIEYYDNLFTPGVTLSRAYGLFSVEYLHEILHVRSLRLRAQALGAVEYRHGNENIHLYYQPLTRPKQPVGERIHYRDWGLTPGIRLSHELSKRFFLAAEVRYSRFLYLHDDGVELPDGGHEGPTPHALTLKYSAGYRF